jgi:hypothetical protein
MGLANGLLELDPVAREAGGATPQLNNTPHDQALAALLDETIDAGPFPKPPAISNQGVLSLQAPGGLPIQAATPFALVPDQALSAQAFDRAVQTLLLSSDPAASLPPPVPAEAVRRASVASQETAAHHAPPPIRASGTEPRTFVAPLALFSASLLIAAIHAPDPGRSKPERHQPRPHRWALRLARALRRLLQVAPDRQSLRLTLG